MAYRGPLQQDVDMQWRENAELRRLESGAPGSTELCVECDSDDVGVGTNRGSALPSESDGAAQTLLLVQPDATIAASGVGTLPGGTAQGPYVGGLQPVFGGAAMPMAVDDDAAAAQVRVSKKKRRKDMLASKWYCPYCKKYTDRGETTCSNVKCAVPMQSSAAWSEAEQMRLQSRQKRQKGRELNSVGAGAAATVPREAAGALDPEQRRALVASETAQLKAVIGNPGTISTDESKMTIIEGFLLVQYQGRHSVHPSVDAAGGIDASVVADFFNTIGRRANDGETVHPMGGYYNDFLERGVTAELLRQLQHIGETQIGGGLRSGGSSAEAVMKNATTFKQWYTSDAGRTSAWLA